MHVFISGRDDLDKTAVIRKTLEMMKPKKIAGFCTTGVASRIEHALKEVYITAAGEEPICDDRHLVGVLWDDDVYTGFPEAFDQGGCAVLNSIPEDAELIVMDELGLFEQSAPLYCATIMRQLDQNTPVLGVLKRRDTPFLDAIRQHPNVTIIEVAEQNYEKAPDLAVMALLGKKDHGCK